MLTVWQDCIFLWSGLGPKVFSVSAKRVRYWLSSRVMVVLVRLGDRDAVSELAKVTSCTSQMYSPLSHRLLKEVGKAYNLWGGL